MNRYNAPAQQMQRFKDAGLNPHLIYSKGTSGNQAQIAQYQQNATDFMQQQPGRLPGAEFQAAQQTYQQMRLNDAQIRQANANAKIAENNAGFSDWWNTPIEGVRTMGPDGEYTRTTASPRQAYEETRFQKNREAVANAILGKETKEQTNIRLAFEAELATLGFTKSDHVLLRMFLQQKEARDGFQSVVNNLGQYISEFLNWIQNK
jgi:hypothetical protein